MFCYTVRKCLPFTITDEFIDDFYKVTITDEYIHKRLLQSHNQKLNFLLWLWGFEFLISGWAINCVGPVSTSEHGMIYKNLDIVISGIQYLKYWIIIILN